jgi:glucuronokinase
LEIIRRRAYARAGLVGNPSDGYHGRTISIIVRNFGAEVVLHEWEDLEIVWSGENRNSFRSIHDLVRDVRLHGYYGGIRLIKATIKKFVEYCQRQGLALHDRNFSVRYASTIPRQVGLAGSSAIVVATLRCLMAFYGVDIPKVVQPSLALAVENDELGIAAGLQDRVIQVYEGLVAMDFTRERVQNCHGFVCGQYEPLDPNLLPPLYVAYKTEVSEPTEVFHNDIRARYQRGEELVVRAMATFASFAGQAREAILNRDVLLLSKLMNQNFDLRRSIYNMPAGQIEMVERARAVGASAKFAGSGGAIVGTYADDRMLTHLRAALAEIGCDVILPGIGPQ